jgi:serine/threonine protein kinase
MPDSRYRITERIAAGGMAEVFKGVAESLQGFRKNVAIKRVLPALTKNQKFITMFLDEARLSLFLQHANIVQVFDIGHADDTYFIVMEFVDGVDLKAIMEWRRRIGRRLTIGQTIYMIMEVCKGLAYAHDLTHPETGERLGIVHRDVSPANVLISKNGEIKLADFGLAKAASQVESTDPGVVKGKMSYLSPEAARGENVDQRADIFSVGILLYEMLTSKRLFYGDTDYQTVELVRNAKIPPIATQNPEVEPEFEEICRKALARRTEDRFQTATDLQDALAHYLFSRGLKMIQRDISELVRACIEDQATQSSGGKAKRFGTIDTVLHSELDAFTSLEFDNAAQEGGQVLAPADGGAQVGSFIDPRAWSSEADWPGKTHQRPARYRRRISARDSQPYPARHRQRDASQAEPAHARRRPRRRRPCRSQAPRPTYRFSRSPCRSRAPLRPPAARSTARDSPRHPAWDHGWRGGDRRAPRLVALQRTIDSSFLPLAPRVIVV